MDGISIFPFDPLAWKKDAACANKPTEWWFPPRGAPREDINRAVQICGGCSVRPQCREWAMSHAEQGIWGGLTGRQIAIQRREGQRGVVRTCSSCNNPVVKQFGVGGPGYCNNECERLARLDSNRRCYINKGA